MPNNLPVSDLEKLLEKVAEECSETNADYQAILPILRRKLLPLLQAGEALAEHVDTLSYDDVNEPHNCSGCQDGVKKVRAALKAALEGK